MLRSAADVIQPVPGEVGRPARWVWAVAVLAVCHAAAVATFQILNILVEPIKASLHVSDTQYSLMQGLAVAIFASLLGIPAARVADRGNRRLVVLVGVVTWSAASVAGAAAQSSSQLFAARMLVGLGEAFLYPAALSMIADLAPPHRLATAVGAFGCGGPVGTALALIGGGWLVRNQGRIAGDFPWVAGEVWRTAFLLCGAFGAGAAALLLSVSEPGHPRIAESSDSYLGATVSHVRQHWKVFAGVSGAMLALSYCVFATSSWSPTMLVRVHGMTYASVAPITGLAALIGGALGAWVSGIATDRIAASGHRDAALQVAMAVAALILLTTLGAVLLPSAGWAAMSLCITYALLGVPTVLGGTALQQISPPAIRAQVMAVQVLLVNLIALSLGPFTVAALTDYFFRRPGAVGYALLWTNGLGASAAIAAILACRRLFSEQRRRESPELS